MCGCVQERDWRVGDVCVCGCVQGRDWRVGSVCVGRFSSKLYLKGTDPASACSPYHPPCPAAPPTTLSWEPEQSQSPATPVRGQRSKPSPLRTTPSIAKALRTQKWVLQEEEIERGFIPQESWASPENWGPGREEAQHWGKTAWLGSWLSAY